MHKKAAPESMGFIYGHATAVVMVLVKESLAALTCLCQLESATVADAPDVMDTLDADLWIKCVWTYQEVVISKVLFVGEGVDDTIIKGEWFLNHFRHCMTSFQWAIGIIGFAFREQYPYLDAFEELVADWFVASFKGRSAFLVMSDMFYRLWHEDVNYFYPITGAITDRPSPRRSCPMTENLAGVVTVSNHRDSAATGAGEYMCFRAVEFQVKPVNCMAQGFRGWQPRQYSIGATRCDHLHQDLIGWLQLQTLSTDNLAMQAAPPHYWSFKNRNIVIVSYDQLDQNFLSDFRRPFPMLSAVIPLEDD